MADVSTTDKQQVKLTKVERKLLGHLRAFHHEHGRMPKYCEITPLMGWKAHGPVRPYLDRLIVKGMLRAAPGGIPVEFVQNGTV
jgi:hypothetical protein